MKIDQLMTVVYQVMDIYAAITINFYITAFYFTKEKAGPRVPFSCLMLLKHFPFHPKYTKKSLCRNYFSLC